MQIPSYLRPRDHDVLIRQRYDVVQTPGVCDDFHVAIYFIDTHRCKVIVRRLDADVGWNQELKICIDGDNERLLLLGPSDVNVMIVDKDTQQTLCPAIYSDQKIPKRIVQTFKSVKAQSLQHYNAVMTFTELNPEYEYHFLDDQGCRAFIHQHFDERTLDAYDLLRPKAYRSDLFRVCYIYVHGGCYFDHKQILRKPLHTFVRPSDKNLFCLDRGPKHMYQAVFMSVAKSDILRAIVERIVDNVHSNYYGANPLSPTGPHMFYAYTHRQNVRLIHHPTLSLIYDAYTGERIVSNFFRGYYHKHRGEQYGPIWEKRQIYFRNLVKILHKRYVIMTFPSVFHDRFIFEIDGRHLKISRQDSTEGWGQNLRIRVIDQNDHTHRDLLVGPSSVNEKVIPL